MCKLEVIPLLMLSGCSLLGNHEQANMGVDLTIHQVIECKSACKADQTTTGQRSTNESKKTVEGSM